MDNIYNAIQNLYNMDKTTWQEVLAELYNLVANIENKFDLFELKFGSLLGEQVIKELKKMYDNGSLASLINDKLLKDINKKVDTFKTEVSSQLETIAKYNNVINLGKMGLNSENVSYNQSTKTYNMTDISNTIKEAINSNCDTIIFPQGNYLIENTITISKPIVLIGNGCNIYSSPSTKNKAIIMAL